MKLKVEKKQIPLILGLIAVIAAVLVYFLVYQKYQEKIAEVESANSKLQSQIDDLTGKANSRAFYESELERMELGIQKAYNCFPPMLEEEDAVMEAMRLEALAPMQVMTLDFQEPVALYTVGSGPTDGQAAAAAPAEDAPVGETTLEEDVAAAQAGETTTYRELQVPDLNFSTGTLPAGYQGEYGPITLNVNVVNMNFMTSYEGIKRTLEYFINNENRRTVQNISLAFNEDTALLTVSAVINEYSLTGTGKVYEYPVLPSVAVGRSNIFGSAEFANPELLEAFLRGNADLSELEGAAAEGQTEGEQAEGNNAAAGNNAAGNNAAGNNTAAALNTAGNLAAELPTVVNPVDTAAQPQVVQAQ